MRKITLLTLLLSTVTTLAFSQSDKFWSANNENKNSIATNKAVARLSYPKEFKLFNLSAAPFTKELFSVVENQVKRSTIISLPNAAGSLEQFEVFESSNFEPALQAQFPAIRAYSGRGITDKFATVKLSISPQGMQSMVFRTDRANEFIEPYSQDHTVYSVYATHRDKGQLPWTCSTPERQMMDGIQGKVNEVTADLTGGSNGTLKTMRLAQSCNGEYSNYFGATSAAQVSLVLAAFNATLTRCNGVYEKDLALHLNLIANTADVIYYNPSTDPYTTMSNWNNQLQSTLTSVIGEANYDIGHMFGASGGGGNAGCIGCVCVNGSKGRGITSPADAIPQGDNFDIDYVAHEIGHQLGANHTFSQSLEGTGVNKEVGSGITIMGYAGITSYDVARHSIDIFHQASIAQIQANLANKTCPVSIAMTANTAPSVAAVSNYTIPISTPFALTASATDAENDPLTYCWEQNDNATTSGASSVASPTKTTGPNWLTFSATPSGTRTFPKLSTILAGLYVTPTQGGDAAANTEALSSISRTLNFRVTVRDNSPYVAGSTIGQTGFTDAVVTVTSTSGPFAVTAPNTNITWGAGTNQTVTWSVNGTNGGAVNCATVNILLSTDGGQTFPTVLAAATANDGSQVVTIPGTTGTTNRIKVEAVGNIFFDISNTNFTIGTPPACGDATGLNTTAITTNSATVNWTAVANALSYDVQYKTASSGTWPTAINTTSTSLNLSGLSASTLYDWRVVANCSGGSGNLVAAQFTTSTAGGICPGTYDLSTNGTTGGSATIPMNTDIRGTISPRNDNDYYRLIITTGGSVIISLTTLPANYELALLNSSGGTLVSSSSNGTASETINTTLSAATYFIRVYPKGNANNATSCYTLRVTGTASRGGDGELITSSRVNIFPNPANNKLTVAIDGLQTTADIKVYNVMGKLVMRQIATKANSELNISKLSSGVYMLNVNDGTTVKSVKFVKE